jgi:hypothetical protein
MLTCSAEQETVSSVYKPYAHEPIPQKQEQQITGKTVILNHTIVKYRTQHRETNRMMQDDTNRLKHKYEDRWLAGYRAKGCKHVLTGLQVAARDVTTSHWWGSLAYQWQQGT